MGGVVGLDLAGDETDFPNEAYIESWLLGWIFTLQLFAEHVSHVCVWVGVCVCSYNQQILELSRGP